MDALFTTIIAAAITLILGYAAGYKKTQEVKVLIKEGSHVAQELADTLKEWNIALEDDKVSEEEFRKITTEMLALQREMFEFWAALKAVVMLPIRNGGEGLNK
jgi:hypothetical protein